MAKDKKNKVLLFVGNYYENMPSYIWLNTSLLYLTAPLIELDIEPVVIVEFIDSDYEDIIAEHADDCIIFGVSATSLQILSGLRASRLFRKYAPNTPIIWGGTHPYSLPEQTLKHDLVDMVALYPAEYSFSQLVHKLKYGMDISCVSGLVYKSNGKFIHTGKPVFNDLSNFPPFPYHIFGDLERYINPETRVLNYVSSCGCPHACSFCSIGIRDPWKSLPVNRILNDVEWLAEQYKLRTIYFNDSDLFYNKNRIVDFCSGLKNNFYWRGEGHVISLMNYSREEFKMMADSGLDMVFMGIEATTHRMQKVLRKTFDLKYVDTILERARGLDIGFYLSFMYGAPTDTIEDLEHSYNTLQRWKNINENVQFQTSIFTSFPAVQLTEVAVDNGFEEPKTLEEWGNFMSVYGCKDRFFHRPWYDDNFNKEYEKRFYDLFPDYPLYRFKTEYTAIANGRIAKTGREKHRELE